MLFESWWVMMSTASILNSYQIAFYEKGTKPQTGCWFQRVDLGRISIWLLWPYFSWSFASYGFNSWNTDLWNLWKLSIAMDWEAAGSSHNACRDPQRRRADKDLVSVFQQTQCVFPQTFWQENSTSMELLVNSQTTFSSRTVRWGLVEANGCVHGQLSSTLPKNWFIISLASLHLFCPNGAFVKFRPDILESFKVEASLLIFHLFGDLEVAKIRYGMSRDQSRTVSQVDLTEKKTTSRQVLQNSNGQRNFRTHWKESLSRLS